MAYDPEKVTLFAKTDARGQDMPFGIKAKDRARHVYVIGKTGMGKSTMLENMAVQDIQNGEGMAFIDPHGSTAETLLDFIPEHRMKDVLYFAPHDMEHPVSFNIMEDVGPDKRHLVVSGLMSVFEKIWVDAWSARMAYILQNTLMALLEYPDATLLGVNRMLSDKEYRKRVVANVKDPGVKSFWEDEFAKYNERYMQEAGDAIKNKIGQFTANPVIRNIIGQPKSSFDIREIMDQKKILIMNLSKGLIGETNANLLGSMLTTRIYLAAMSRADLGQHEMRAMPNFYFYVDEFQSFANATFSNILSEARKYKLNLTIAHQYIEQMEEEVRNAVFGNVGTIVAFRVGPFDAEVLETIFSPRFFATDIVNLGFAQVYLTLMIDGIGSQPFSAVTLPPIQPPAISYKDVVIAASQEQFANRRKEVEEAVSAFHAPLTPESDGKKSGKGGANNSGSSNGPLRQGSVRDGRGEAKNSAPRRGDDSRSGGNRGDDTKDRNNRRNTSGTSSESGREHNSRRSESGGARTDRRPERDERTVDDLRSTLRTIVEKDGAKKAERNGTPRPREQKGRHGENQKGNEQKTDASERTDLRQALASVLPQSAPATSLKETQKNTDTPEASSQAQEVAVTPEKTEDQQRGSDISPKELERMMRVTTSDKPPLK